ncbi:MAG: hypothetical protein SFU25_05855 [Candidatus Caenarcaniphilales bacterium]|nr:hypothetical protein [Candidatus Caenarcaniphilales bacterium]
MSLQVSRIHRGILHKAKETKTTKFDPAEAGETLLSLAQQIRSNQPLRFDKMRTGYVTSGPIDDSQAQTAVLIRNENGKPSQPTLVQLLDSGLRDFISSDSQTVLTQTKLGHKPQVYATENNETENVRILARERRGKIRGEAVEIFGTPGSLLPILEALGKGLTSAAQDSTETAA